jgi:hypothetical protein
MELLEQLESRRLFNATITSTAPGLLRLIGDNSGNVITVKINPDDDDGDTLPEISVKIGTNPAADYPQMPVNGAGPFYNITWIDIVSGNGADSIQVYVNADMASLGYIAAYGGEAVDYIKFFGTGNHNIDKVAYGGPGNDGLAAQTDRTTLEGGAHDDTYLVESLDATDEVHITDYEGSNTVWVETVNCTGPTKISANSIHGYVRRMEDGEYWYWDYDLEWAFFCC